MKVYLNTFPWHVSPKNTDWRLNWEVARLSEQFPEVETYLPQSGMTAIGPNFAYAARAVIMRLGLREWAPLSWFPGVKANYVWPPEFRRIAPDVIFTHEHFPLNAGRTPIVFSPGFEDPAEARAANVSEEFLARERVLKRRLAQRSAIVSLSNEDAARRMMRDFPESAHKVRVLPFYRPDLRAVPEEVVVRKQTREGPLRILFVGLEVKRKGLDTLFAAFEQLHQFRPGAARLDVVSDFRGGGVTRPSGLPITFHGALPYAQVIQLFAEAQIFAMPSRRESYGFVYVESMAHGCVTIAPTRVIQRELLAEGDAGVLVPAEDADKLAAALLGLLDSPERRLHLSLAGRARYLRHYDAPVVGRRFVEAFADAVRVGRSGG